MTEVNLSREPWAKCPRSDEHEPHWHTIRADGITYGGGRCDGKPQASVTSDDQSAREALVEQLAEAMHRSSCAGDDYRECVDKHLTWGRWAEAAADVVAAQVEAAVSVVRAEVAQVEAASVHWMRQYDAEKRALRALREGLEALADDLTMSSDVELSAGDVGGHNAYRLAARDLRALLAPSPAEALGDWFRRTPESLAMLAEERKALDAIEAAPSPAEGTGEAGGPMCVDPECDQPAVPGRLIDLCQPHMDAYKAWVEAGRPAPVVTPSAEDGA